MTPLNKPMKTAFAIAALLIFSMPLTSNAGSDVRVGDYPKGWNGIKVVSIKKEFLLENYQQVDVFIDVLKPERQENQTEEEVELRAVRKRFPDLFFAALKDEKSDINFVRLAEDPTTANIRQASESSDKVIKEGSSKIDVALDEQKVDSENNSLLVVSKQADSSPVIPAPFTNSPPKKSLLVKVRLLGFHSGSGVGSYFAWGPVKAIIKRTRDNWDDAYGPFAAILLDGEIIDLQTGELLATFKHRHDRDAPITRSDYEEVFNKITKKIGDEIANFIGDFDD